MLILARKCAQEITFPDLNIRIEVLAAKPGLVRLGVEAPPEVRVLRGELPDRVAEWGPEPDATVEHQAATPKPQLEQLTRNGLTVASVGLGLARLQARLGSTDELQQTLEQLHQQLQWLRDQWQPSSKTCPAAPLPLASLCGV